MGIMISVIKCVHMLNFQTSLAVVLVEVNELSLHGRILEVRPGVQLKRWLCKYMLEASPMLIKPVPAGYKTDPLLGQGQASQELW